MTEGKLAPDLASRTSVLLPAYREEDSIEALIEEIRAIGEWKEIVVVDDGSPDATAERAARAGARVVRHPYNKGNGAAVKSALRAATGELVLLLDADGQHPPDAILRLLAELEVHDLVVGARSFRGQASLSRALGNGALNRFASILSGFPIKDLTSGFRAARRARLMEFIHLFPNGFSYPATSTLAFIKTGYNVSFVPIEGRKRTGREKSKMRPWREGWRFLLIVVRLTTLFYPMRVVLPLSLAFFLPGAGYMSYTIATRTDVTDSAILLIALSVILFVFGLLSEQIAALRLEKKD